MKLQKINDYQYYKMPKYYCDYCKSYLTHDKMSVRKSHLVGKNHIRKYCLYYEEKAKQLGIWDTNDFTYEVDMGYLSQGAPSPEKFSRKILRSKDKSFVRQKDEAEKEICLPPPPNLANLAPPPPSAIRHTDEYIKAITTHVSLATHDI